MRQPLVLTAVAAALAVENEAEGKPMRRSSLFVSILAIVPLGLLAVSRTGPTTAQDTTPPAEGQGLVGSWRVMAVSPDEPPELSLGTFGADGTVVTSPRPVFPPMPGGPGGVIFTSAGHGAWEATGPDTATVTFVVLTADGQGNQLFTVTVRATGTLGADGQTFSGEGTRTFTDPAGNTMMTQPVVVEATRIVAEAPAA
ncbi:MAG: hypothetical protein ACRDJH_19135 [Thermomicrobiales bacterium]